MTEVIAQASVFDNVIAGFETKFKTLAEMVSEGLKNAETVAVQNISTNVASAISDILGSIETQNTRIDSISSIAEATNNMLTTLLKQDENIDPAPTIKPDEAPIPISAPVPVPAPVPEISSSPAAHGYVRENLPVTEPSILNIISRTQDLERDNKDLKAEISSLKASKGVFDTFFKERGIYIATIMQFIVVFVITGKLAVTDMVPKAFDFGGWILMGFFLGGILLAFITILFIFVRNKQRICFHINESLKARGL